MTEADAQASLDRFIASRPDVQAWLAFPRRRVLRQVDHAGVLSPRMRDDLPNH